MNEEKIKNTMEKLCRDGLAIRVQDVPAQYVLTKKGEVYVEKLIRKSGLKKDDFFASLGLHK